jgi:GMP synthase-like glutamine amidotransferase
MAAMSDVVRTLAVVQHTSSEYLGLMEDHLEGRRIRFRYFRPFTSGGRLPSPVEAAGGLVLLGGGPWGGAPGARRLPSLDAEVELTAAALAADTPVIGIGLGALILALAAGGVAAPGPLVFEVGTARRVVPEALGGLLPQRYPLVRYARDEVTLPPAARVLARDDRDAPALFQVGEHAFGFSGHPGVKSAIIEDLIMEFPESPPETGARLAALRQAQPAVEAALVPIMTGLTRSLRLMEEMSSCGRPQ